jgi:hypothetical protein
MIGAKDKNVATMWMDKVIAKLIDENLITSIDGAARDRLAGMINVAGEDLEILPQNLRRCVNREGLMIADDPRKGEEEEELSGRNIHDRVLRARDDVDVVAAEDDKINHLLKEVRRGCGRGMADDAIERRLHRAGRDFERLDEVRPDADRYDDRDQDHFDIFAPDGVLMRRGVRSEESVEPLRFVVRRVVIARPHRGAHFLDLGLAIADSLKRSRR